MVYAPTNCADEEEIEKFFDDLRNALEDVPAHNFLAVMGDFNARLGPKDAPFTLHKETNRNGKYLADLLVEFDLVAANTQFQKRQESCGPSRKEQTIGLHLDLQEVEEQYTQL